MFDRLPFNNDLDFLDNDNNMKGKNFDGIFYVNEDEDGIFITNEKNFESYYLKNESDKIKLRNYIGGYVYAGGEYYSDETCILYLTNCKNYLKKINKHPELGLDYDTIFSLYYLPDSLSERLIDIMVCCFKKEKYNGALITKDHLKYLVKWLIKKVKLNQLLKKQDIFENVYMPNGQKMDQEVYNYIVDIERFEKNEINECLHYLLFVSRDKFEFKMLFYETYHHFVEKYPNYENEIKQILNYLFSMGAENPMNTLFKGANINDLLMILKEICEYNDIHYVEFALSSFGDAGDLSGFNSTYMGSEKGRIAEKVLKYRTTNIVMVLKGLDEVNTNSSNHSSVLAALFEILSTRKLNDNYLKYSIDLSNTFIVGTCFDHKKVNSSIYNYFYSIKESEHHYKDLIENEFNSLLNSLDLGYVKVDSKVIDRISYIASMDPFNEIYKKYCNLIVHYYGNQIRGRGMIDLELVQEVFDNFEICDDSMKHYFENYEDYDENIIQRFKQLFFDLKCSNKEIQNSIQNKISYLSCCRKNKTSKIDLDKVSKILNETHIGLDNVKDVLLNTLYQYSYDKFESNHLLFYSTHPGVGKTSIALDACKACDIPIIHINCAQISNLASLYGDNIRPGLLLTKIKEIETIQAPIFFDEFEKCDPAIQNSLLNLTDTSNASFYSPYLEVNVPIHCRFIIATANDLSRVSEALRDRFRVVEFKPYSIETKVKIIRDKILKDLESNYNKKLEISDKIIYDYLSSHPFASIRDMKSDLNYLYVNQLRNANHDLINHYNYECCKDTINGLGVVGNHGCAFKIECLLYDGSDQLKGNCKEVFNESFDIVLMALRHHHILDNEHVFMNIYGNSLEKNGPSAGLAMFACIYSKKMNIDLHDYAFTGELTIHGNVEAVGGIYYKLLACKQAGISKVVLPYNNYKDYVEIADDLEGLEVYFVKNIFECIELFNQ